MHQLTLTPQQRCFAGATQAKDFLNNLIPYLSAEDQAHLSAVNEKCQEAFLDYTKLGVFSHLPPDVLGYLFQNFLDRELWETVSKVCIQWNTLMKDVKWREKKEDPAISEYIDFLTVLIEEFDPSPGYAEPKKALENIRERLLQWNKAKPESLSAILAYDTQIDREIAEILFKIWDTDNDYSLDFTALWDNFMSYQASINSLCPSQSTCDRILPLISSICLPSLTKKVPMPPDFLPADAIERGIYDLGNAKHLEESIKLHSFIPNVILPAKPYFEVLIQLGLFDKAFSLAENPYSCLNQEATEPDFLKKTFCQACIQQGCVATADLAFRRFRTAQSCDPGMLKDLAEAVALTYLSEGKLEKAMPFIETYHFHLNPSFMESAVQNVAQAGYTEEALTLISMHEKSRLRPYQKRTDVLLGIVSRAPIRRENLEATESFIRSYLQGNNLVSALNALAISQTDHMSREKSIALLVECAPLTKDNFSFTATCHNLCHFERRDLAIELMEQNSSLHALFLKEDCRENFAAFITGFSLTNQAIIRENPSAVENCREITQRLIDILRWLESIGVPPITADWEPILRNSLNALPPFPECEPLSDNFFQELDLTNLPPLPPLPQ